MTRLKMYWKYIKYVLLILAGVGAGVGMAMVFRKNPTNTENKINESKKKLKESIDFDRKWLATHGKRSTI